MSCVMLSFLSPLPAHFNTSTSTKSWLLSRSMMGFPRSIGMAAVRPKTINMQSDSKGGAVNN